MYECDWLTVHVLHAKENNIRWSANCFRYANTVYAGRRIQTYARVTRDGNSTKSFRELKAAIGRKTDGLPDKPEAAWEWYLAAPTQPIKVLVSPSPMLAGIL